MVVAPVPAGLMMGAIAKKGRTSQPEQNAKTTLASQPQQMIEPQKRNTMPAESGRKAADSGNRPLNKTFTITRSLLKPRSPTPFRRRRSNSIDSDFGHFGQDVIIGLIRRSEHVILAAKGSSMKEGKVKGKGATKSGWGAELAGWMPAIQSLSCSGGPPKAANGSTKLPPLEGFAPNRTCCCDQYITRAKFELIKYKRNLN